jgi:hypothetical protein
VNALGEIDGRAAVIPDGGVFGVTGLLPSLLFGVEAFDAMTFGSMSAVRIAVALLTR